MDESDDRHGHLIPGHSEIRRGRAKSKEVKEKDLGTICRG